MKYLTKYLLFSLFSFLILSPAVVAQEDDAEKVMEEVEDRYEDAGAMIIQYSQKIENPDSDLKQVLDGTLYTMGDKYKVKSAGQEIIYDGDKIYLFNEADNEVVITRADDDDDMLKPSDIFKLYKKDFKYRISSSAVMNGKRYYVISFVPKDADTRKKASFHTIKLYVAMDDYSIGQAQIIDKNNTTVTFSIRDVNMNAQLSDSFFSFDPSKYPDIIVTDKTK